MVVTTDEDFEIEVITRYEHGIAPTYSVDGGKTYHKSIKEAIRALEQKL
jgi:hypothetical protein